MKNSSGKLHRSIKILISIAVVLIISTVCLIIPLRPTISETEKRELAKFPEFSFSAIADGSYFSDISKWFSDTVPFRDTLVGWNIKLQNLLGTSGAVRGFQEAVKNNDEIPDIIPTPSEIVTNEAGEDIKEYETIAPEEITFPDVDNAPPIIEQLGYIAVCGDAGYEYYNFVQSTADNYVKAINTAAAKFSGQADIYSSIAPGSTDITLDDENRAKISGSVSDQKKAISYMLGSTSSSVRKFDCFDNLKLHRNEYVYFRTDHHWTALGAYYAYEEFCKTKGITPLKINDFEVWSFDGFLGTFYNDSNNHPALGANPDRVDAYKPPCNYTTTLTKNDGSTQSWFLLYDESNAPASLKYGTFIGGDNPLTTITNTSKTEGETCLVIKESFGNAFVPFLVYHYKTVYVVDYRHYNKTLSEFLNEHPVDDIIFMNNISMTRNADLVNRMSAFIAG